VTTPRVVARSAMRRVPLVLMLLLACDQPQTEQARRARAAAVVRRLDSTMPPDVIIRFTAPASWEVVRLSRGIEYRRPPGSTIGLSDVMLGGCDAETLPADMPLFQQSISNSWPLTVAMRRGDLARLARANGFILDSAVIATYGQAPSDSTSVRRGEGWLLLSGRTQVRNLPLPVSFGALRYPGGCYLVVASRGVDLNVDTLGYVLSTVRFGPSAVAQPE
jgi:hypothetical protein